MATKQSTVDTMMEQLSGAGAVSARKMFGEYGVYLSGKIIALICDDQLFIKPTIAGRALLSEIVEAPPYPGAKMYFAITDEQIEDGELMTSLLRAMVKELPAPPVKKPKVRKAAKKVS